MFQDRKDAGRQLAEKIAKYKNTDAVVLALPRGGVVVGYEISKILNLPLDIVVPRKIGHPNNSEYAICVTDEKGTLLCDERERSFANEEWLIEEIQRQKEEALRRVKLYRGERKPVEIKGKTVIITDDGIATGLTMRLAVKIIQKQKPARIIVAVPVAPTDAVSELKKEAQEVIVLESPEQFLGAVGAHYQEFEQVEDGTVIRLLQSLQLV